MTFVSYAKNHEDYRLFLALEAIDQGRYIDLCAAADQLGSISQAFYERGWSGICHQNTGHNRKRDHQFAGALGDLVRLERDWIRADTIHFMAIDAVTAAQQLSAFFECDEARPWLLVVRNASGTATNDDIAGVLAKAGYIFSWSDGVNHFWVIGSQKALVTSSFSPLTHRDALIGIELLLLRVESRTNRRLAQELIKTNQLLAERDKKILELNLGFETCQLAHQNAINARDALLAAVNQKKPSNKVKLIARCSAAYWKARALLVNGIRLPARKLFAYIERRPLLLARLMQKLSAHPALEKIARKIVGKPKLVKSMPMTRQVDEPCPTLSPDALKAYHQIIGS
jgi:hypothetical protein